LSRTGSRFQEVKAEPAPSLPSLPNGQVASRAEGLHMPVREGMDSQGGEGRTCVMGQDG